MLARGAIVGGDVSEADIGNVSLRGGTSINGVVEESGDGSVNVTVDVLRQRERERETRRRS